MSKRRPLRVALFVDGYTLKKVNEYYRYFHPYHTRLDFRGIKNWARREAVRLFSPRCKFCMMEAHYYHPTKKDESYGLVGLERELNHAGFNVHYSEAVNQEGATPNLDLIEDAMMFASFKRMDVAVLLSTQGQYSPFPDRLKLLGVPTLLLGWNFTYPKADRWVCWKTDTGLKETCAYYVAMERVANNHPPSNGNVIGLFHQHGAEEYPRMRA